MDKNQSYDFFRTDKCKECGTCLSSCVYLDLSKEEAIQHIRDLKSGKGSDYVLKNCISCYACDSFCPNDAMPYELILSYRFKRYQEKKLPVRANYLMPHQQPNFRSYVVNFMNEQDRKDLEKWENEDPTGKTVLYPGCNLLTIPYLVRASFMADLPVSGRFELCCGEMYFRLGFFDKIAQVAERLTEYYKKHNPEKLVFICPAGYNIFTNVLPKQFGAEFNFETQLLTDWILERIENGKIEITNQLDYTITVHDSCHARILGDKVMQSNRTLYKKLGLNIVEMDHNKEYGYCCGVAAGTTNYSSFDIIKSAVKEIKEARKTKADMLALYCSGCLIGMEVVKKVYPFGQDIFHTVELVQMATGEIPEHRHGKTSFQMLKGIMRHAIPKYASTKRDYLDDINLLDEK